MRAALKAAILAVQRATVARHRLETKHARTDTKIWVVQRRERTHQMIELGGLVGKAGLVELMDDDRAALHGALLEIAARLTDVQGAGTLALWRRHGKRAFDLEAE